MIYIVVDEEYSIDVIKQLDGKTAILARNSSNGAFKTLIQPVTNETNRFKRNTKYEAPNHIAAQAIF